ncbi:hypothetical protein IJ182_03920 [bacterium]|nr:hypothetical protein [bacterium]
MERINNINLTPQFFQTEKTEEDKNYDEYAEESIFQSGYATNDDDIQTSEIEFSSREKEAESISSNPNYAEFPDTVFNEQGKVTFIRFFNDAGEMIGYDTYIYDSSGNPLERVSYNANNDIIYKKNCEYYDDGNVRHEDEVFYRDDGSTITSKEKEYYQNGTLKSNVETSYNPDNSIKEKSDEQKRSDGTRVSMILKTYDENTQGYVTTEIYYNENDDVEEENYYNKDNILTYSSHNTYNTDGSITTETKEYSPEGEMMDNYSYTLNSDYEQTEYVQYNPQGEVLYRETTEYNEAGFPSVETILDGNNNVIKKTVNEYDDNNNKVSSCVYNAAGEITETSDYKYNDAGLITEKVSRNKEGNVIEESYYTYNNDIEPFDQHTTIYDDEGNVIFEFKYEYGEVWDYDNESENYTGEVLHSYNGDIDGDIGYTRQGYIGDCWLLSGVTALNFSEQGQALLKNAVTYNDDDTYTVNFKGIGTEIKITKEELEDAKNTLIYSQGDDDMIILELAFEAALDKIQSGEIEVTNDHPKLTVNDNEGDLLSSLDGGFFEDVIFLLTGDNVQQVSHKDENSNEKFDEVLDKLQNNPESISVTLGFLGEDLNQQVVITDIDNNYVYTVQRSGHAFSIKSVDGDNVTIVNPEDSSKEYVISRETLKQYAYDLEYYEF